MNELNFTNRQKLEMHVSDSNNTLLPLQFGHGTQLLE